MKHISSCIWWINSDSPSRHIGWCKIEFLMHILQHQATFSHIIDTKPFWDICYLLFYQFFFCLYFLRSGIWWGTRIPLQDNMGDVEPSFRCLVSINLFSLQYFCLFGWCESYRFWFKCNFLLVCSFYFLQLALLKNSYDLYIWDSVKDVLQACLQLSIFYHLSWSIGLTE